jgi:hypothetical protein
VTAENIQQDYIFLYYNAEVVIAVVAEILLFYLRDLKDNINNNN